jgi:hypothetical protein
LGSVSLNVTQLVDKSEVPKGLKKFKRIDAKTEASAKASATLLQQSGELEG